MKSKRKTAIIVGALFITATVTAVLSLIFLGSILVEPDYLVNIPANQNNVIIAEVFELILAVSVIGIGVFMYPVLNNYNESLALGYVVIRLIEGIFILFGSIGLLSLLTLSQEYTAAAPDVSSYLPLGTLSLVLRNWSIVFGTLVFLGLGGLVLNYLLFISKLIPLWLSVWGLIGAVLILVAGILSLFGLKPESAITTMLALPIAVQEMVFAVLLILKGFNPVESASQNT